MSTCLAFGKLTGDVNKILCGYMHGHKEMILANYYTCMLVEETNIYLIKK